MPRGRPAKPGWSHYHVKLPDEVIERIDVQADKESRARSELLADGAELYLKRAKKKPAKREKE